MRERPSNVAIPVTLQVQDYWAGRSGNTAGYVEIYRSTGQIYRTYFNGKYGVDLKVDEYVIEQSPGSYTFDTAAAKRTIDPLCQDLIEDTEPPYPVNPSPLETWVKSDKSLMRDVVTPEFEKRKAEGHIINNPMEKSRSVMTLQGVKHVPFVNLAGGSSHNFRIRGTGGLEIMEFNVSFINNVAQPACVLPPDAHDFLQKKAEGVPLMDGSLAVADCHSRMHAAEMELLLFLAELGESVDSVRLMISRFTNIVRDIKRGRWRKWAPKAYRKLRKDPKRFGDLFLDAWMEARYAWRPIMYDIQDTMRALSSALAPRQTFRAFDNLENTDSGTETFRTKWWDVDVTWRMTSSSNARAGILGEYRTSMHETFHTWGLTNLATVAWDLIPYSFCVDWVLDVGGLLYRLNPNPLWKPQASWLSRNTETSVMFEAKFRALEMDITEEIRGEFLVRYQDREPEPEIPLISIAPNYSWAKFIDTLALLRRFRS